MHPLQPPGHILGVKSNLKNIGGAAIETVTILTVDAFKIMIMAENFIDLIAAPTPEKHPWRYPAVLKDGGDNYRFGYFCDHNVCFYWGQVLQSCTGR